MKLTRRALFSSAGVVLALAAGGSAYAASSVTASPPKPVAGYACEGTGHVTVTVLSTPSSKCPAGTMSVVFGAQGPAGAVGATGPAGLQGPKGDAGADGATGATGAAGPKGDAGAAGAQGLKGDTGATGPQGPKGDAGAAGADGAPGAAGPQGPKGDTGAQGPAGPPGTSYQPVTQSAVFTLTGRPDSGNNSDWATDNITRTATVTRHAAAPASDCGTAAISCWFFTMTISDTGTFTTDSGAYSPNQATPGTKIAGVLTGNLTGGGNQQFYADANPQMPVTLSYAGSGPLGTSSWYKLFFPDGTNFGDAPATSAGVPWTSWSWSYAAPATCETWTDAYNNGDGNQAPDGNIAGVNACGT